jgi:hypothetical protein
MRINLHGTEIVNTSSEGDVIEAEVMDRDRNSVHMLFDCVDDVERLAEELRFMAESIRESEPKDVCAETGEVLA